MGLDLPLDVDAFEHPDAQRRFRVVNDVEELERARRTLGEVDRLSPSCTAGDRLGAAMSLTEASEAADGKLYFLLHPTGLVKHHDAYIRTKNILNKVPLDHEIYEEDEAARLVAELRSHITGEQ